MHLGSNLVFFFCWQHQYPFSQSMAGILIWRKPDFALMTRSGEKIDESKCTWSIIAWLSSVPNTNDPYLKHICLILFVPAASVQDLFHFLVLRKVYLKQKLALHPSIPFLSRLAVICIGQRMMMKPLCPPFSARKKIEARNKSILSLSFSSVKEKGRG